MISGLTAPLLPETVAAYTATIDHTLRTKLHKAVVEEEEEEEEEDKKKKKKKKEEEEEKGGSRKEEEKKPLIAKLIGRSRLQVKLTSCGSLLDLCHSRVGFCGGLFGLRTHLKTFRAIGDHSGGWMEMEETQLRTHLKWERVRIKETVVKFRRISDNREWWIFLHDPSMGGAAQQLTPSEQKTEVPLRTRRYRE
uniref:Hydroxyproline-rich glycoprotein GAS31 n=1 Tax=Solanum tuberosum TaxID=4113 RepID=M1AIE8_SOLTU